MKAREMKMKAKMHETTQNSLHGKELRTQLLQIDDHILPDVAPDEQSMPDEQTFVVSEKNDLYEDLEEEISAFAHQEVAHFPLHAFAISLLLRTKHLQMVSCRAFITFRPFIFNEAFLSLFFLSVFLPSTRILRRFLSS